MLVLGHPTTCIESSNHLVHRRTVSDGATTNPWCDINPRTFVVGVAHEIVSSSGHPSDQRQSASQCEPMVPLQFLTSQRGDNSRQQGKGSFRECPLFFRRRSTRSTLAKADCECDRL